MANLIETIQTSVLEIVSTGIKQLPNLITALVLIVLTYYGVSLVRKLVTTGVERWVYSPSLRSLIVQISVAGAWIIGSLAASVALFPDLELGDIIGFLGLGSVAVGFAFQDIFKNFLAGILLLLNEPFRIQDQIIVDQFEGTVEAISIRSTQLRTYQGERVVIPNSIVFTSPVQVLTDQAYRRTDLAIGVDYNTPLAKAVEIFANTVPDVDGVLRTPEPIVDVVGFGDSSIDFIVRYWTKPQRKEVNRVMTQMMIALKRACDASNIVIPYPIRTVYMFDQQQFSDHFPQQANASTN